MSNQDNEQVQAELKALYDAYAGRVPQKINEIESAWNALEAGDWQESKLIELQRLVHKLAGSGTTFGFHTLSQAARTLELHLETLAEAGTPPGQQQLAQTGTFITNLRRAGTVTTDVDLQDQLDLVTSSDSGETEAGQHEGPALATNATRNRVLIVDCDSKLAAYYALTLQRADLSTRVTGEPEWKKQVDGEWQPDLILIDLYSWNGDTRLVEELKHQGETPLVTLWDTPIPGVVDTLARPVQPQQLVRIICNHLGRQE